MRAKWLLRMALWMWDASPEIAINLSEWVPWGPVWISLTSLKHLTLEEKLCPAMHNLDSKIFGSETTFGRRILFYGSRSLVASRHRVSTVSSSVGSSGASFGSTEFVYVLLGSFRYYNDH